MLTSGLFNAEQLGADEHGIIYDRVYKADFFSKYFSSFISNGIFMKNEEQLQVIESSNMTLTIKGGRAFINGYFCYSDEDFKITLNTSDPLENRIDRIVLQLNLNERDIKVKVLEGIPSVSPQPKEITRNEEIFELALADVLIKTGVETLYNADITDLRLNSDLCGIVTHTLREINTTSLYKQIQSELKEFKEVQEANFLKWFEGVKSLLDENAIETHEQETIFNTNGVHGLRYNQDIKNFEGYKEMDGEWVKLKGLGVGEVTLPDIPYIKVKPTKQGINIYWQDPPNAIINDIEVKKWNGTILVKKIDSPPLAYDDGEILVDNIIRDKYKDTPYIDEDITQDKNTTYYYGIFPYDQDEVYNTSFNNIVSTTGATLENMTYSFILDLNESNPLNNITYVDDSEGYTTPESWDESFLFQAIKPCLLKDGQVQYYLNVNNYAEKENGESSVLNGNDGDVMVEFPALFYKMERLSNRKLKFSISANYDELVNNSEWCKAHLDYNNKTKFGRKLYHSAYISKTLESTKLVSIGTNSSTFSKSRISTLIDRIKLKGQNYFLTGIFDFNLLTLLCWLRFKTTNLQKVFNLEKYANLQEPKPQKYTIGSLKTGGLFSGCGSETPQEAVKICGIEFFCNGYVKNNDFKTQGLMSNIQQDSYGGTKYIYYISRSKMLELGATIYRGNTSDHLYYTDKANYWGYINDFDFSPSVGIIPKFTSGQQNSTSDTYLTINCDQSPSNCTPINYNFFAQKDNGYNMRPSRNGIQYTDQDYSTYFVYIPPNEEEGRA